MLLLKPVRADRGLFIWGRRLPRKPWARRQWGLLVGVALLLCCCGRPLYPVVSPYSVQVVGADPQGLAFRTVFDVYNPNDSSLTLQSVEGSVLLDNRISLGHTEVNTPTHLPNKATQRVVADLKVPWANLPDVVLVSQSKPLVPYTFEGHVRVGGFITIRLPFTMTGQVSSQQILAAGLRGVPVIPSILGMP